MECGICSRALGTKRPATCTSCTRASLHQPRVEQVLGLLGREKAHIHAEAVLRPGNDGIIAALPEDADWEAIRLGIKADFREKHRAQRTSTEARIEKITTQAEELKRQIEECKSYITKRREANERRRKDLAQERKQLRNRMPSAIEPVQSACKKTSRALDKIHTRTAEAREALCKEVAFVNGLGRSRNALGNVEYRLDGLVVPDLRDLNGINGRLRAETLETSSGPKHIAEQHELISASMTNVCRFLAVCCSYLSIRLAAEILLPHNDFPQAMILHERSSYRFNQLDYASLDSSNGSDSAMLRRRKSLPSPRLLQLDRPLPKLQQEDPKTYGLFVEGVMWLAWDIAWLCRTQGIESINSFEEVCEMGKNLHTLFAARESKSHIRPLLSRHTTATSVGKGGGDTKDARNSSTATTASPRFGLLSHTSARDSLAGYAGARLRDGWRLESGSYNRLFDRLRHHLIDETRKAEWTFIDDKEWDDELEHEKPVLVGGSRHRAVTSGPAMSVMTVAGNDGVDEVNDSKRGDEKNGNGWMRVRGRPNEG